MIPSVFISIPSKVSLPVYHSQEAEMKATLQSGLVPGGTQWEAAVPQHWRVHFHDCTFKPRSNVAKLKQKQKQNT